MKTFMMIVSYDGTNYYGWQRQTHLVSIQGTLEKALEKMLREEIRIDGAGRTDAGVHSLGQVATFTTQREVTEDQIKIAVNNLLPEDIVLKSVFQVAPSCHARYHAIGKRYGYKLYRSSFADPFKSRYATRIVHQLDEVAIRKAMEQFIGTHDFATFMATGSKIENTVRTITQFDLFIENDEWYFQITGNGFLYNMVRIIMGTLLDVGRGKISAQAIESIIKSKDRDRAKRTAPSCGLYLEKVYYPEEICRKQG
jgi:tRNA pseudouridine38-40 synthase